MLLERYYDESLAQASFLIGCERAREAIVIDPNPVTQYVPRIRMRIRYVTETHIHADFLSGSRGLARQAGAELLLSGHGGADWSYRLEGDPRARLICDGDSITVGKVRLDVLHTPGHTPEHLSFLVTDTAAGDQPVGLITGDFLFVGDVGRPDLLEKAAKVSGSMDRSARELYRSLQRLAALPDYLQIWPGHGAGSACGKSLGSLPQSTLGYERLYNPALRPQSEDTFVRWVLADQPDVPPYFATMKAWNRDGHGPLHDAEVTAHRNIPPGELEALIAEGYEVVDTRSAERFAEGHIPGSINIPVSRNFATYAGTVLRYDKPLILIADSGRSALSPLGQLAMIGMAPKGVASPKDVDDALRNGSGAGIRKATLPRIEPASLAASGVAPRIIDVRGTSEWKGAHLERATHIYLGNLAERAETLPKNEATVVHCQSGTRSSIAASMLMARGFTNVSNMAGGVDAWRKAGLPLVTED